eukprot:11202631-Lingulodinium_polyedra.AAC.1
MVQAADAAGFASPWFLDQRGGGRGGGRCISHEICARAVPRRAVEAPLILVQGDERRREEYRIHVARSEQHAVL